MGGAEGTQRVALELDRALRPEDGVEVVVGGWTVLGTGTAGAQGQEGEAGQRGESRHGAYISSRKALHLMPREAALAKAYRGRSLRWRRRRSTLRRCDLKAKSKTSPTRGTLPTAQSTPILPSIRTITLVGTPSRQASRMM